MCQGRTCDVPRDVWSLVTDPANPTAPLTPLHTTHAIIALVFYSSVRFLLVGFEYTLWKLLTLSGS